MALGAAPVPTDPSQPDGSFLCPAPVVATPGGATALGALGAGGGGRPSVVAAGEGGGGAAATPPDGDTGKAAAPRALPLLGVEGKGTPLRGVATPPAGAGRDGGPGEMPTAPRAADPLLGVATPPAGAGRDGACAASPAEIASGGRGEVPREVRLASTRACRESERE